METLIHTADGLLVTDKSEYTTAGNQFVLTPAGRRQYAKTLGCIYIVDNLTIVATRSRKDDIVVLRLRSNGDIREFHKQYLELVK